MSTVARADPDGLDLAPIFGPFYWGFVFSMVLGGITILQAYVYFPRTKDKLTLRVVAWFMLALDISSSALVAQSVYYYLIPHSGSLLPLNSITDELSAECFISTIITFISQLYFVWQIYTVTGGSNSTRSLFVPAAIGIFAICAFALGTACTVSMFVHKRMVLGKRSLVFAISFGLAKGFGALTDIAATAALCTYLSASKTRFSQTNSVIKTLMQFIVHRGILVTLIQSLLLIMFFAAPSHLYWLAFHVNVTKLYVNVFFAMLNARITLNKKIHDGAVIQMEDSFFRNTDSNGTFSRGHDTETNLNHGIPSKEKFRPQTSVINVTADFLEAGSNPGNV